jgi:hypothetical protein
MKKKLSLFKKLLLAYTIVLLILSAAFLIYLNRVLIEYENSDITVYLTNVVKKITEEDLSSYFNNKNDSLYEKKPKSLKKAYDELLKSEKINVVKVNDSDSLLTYDVSVGERKIYTIEAERGREITKLGLLNYNEWNIKSITDYFDRGIYSYDLFVPNNFEVLINGVKISPDDFKEELKLSDVEDAYNYSDIPAVNKYEINNLTSEPTIIIKNNFNKEISYEINDNIIDATNGFKVVDTIDSINEYYDTSIDPFDFAKKWSLYMTKDLKGSNYGFHIIKTYLVNKSYLYTHAYKWATGIDITFTPIHILKNPAFTNEKITNCTIYDDNMFSCDVFLEKNMIVAGKDKVDVFNNKIYYIKHDNEWNVIAMKTILGE